MPDRGHTESSQVLGREPWQNLGVDLIVAEDGLVTLQAQLPQPSRDVHSVPHGDGDCLAKATRVTGWRPSNPFAATMTPSCQGSSGSPTSLSKPPMTGPLCGLKQTH